jgi:hypothetical protein
MHYVTYDEAGNLTGAYLQDLHPEHEAVHIEVTPEQYADWVNFKANETRDGLELAPVVVAQPTVPAEIPMLNAHLEMIHKGWMVPVRAHINAMPEPHRSMAHAYLDKALTMKRDHPLVLDIPAAIGKTSAEVDEMFIAAAAREV